MEKQGTIEIHVVGQVGNNQLSQNNYDIREIKYMLDNIEDMLYPNNKKNRPNITYDIESGSVRNIFKTSMQAVVSFSAVISIIESTNSLDSLENTTAKAFEQIQETSKKKNYSFEFLTSDNINRKFIINPQTNYIRSQNLWVDAELYFYGILTDAGGKNKVNIHLETEEYGLICIDTDRNILIDRKENILYKKFGVRAKGKQNIETGEIDKYNLKLIELIDYSPKYDENYINKLIHKVGNKFDKIDIDKWILDMRGDYI